MTTQLLSLSVEYVMHTINMRLCLSLWDVSGFSLGVLWVMSEQFWRNGCRLKLQET